MNMKHNPVLGSAMALVELVTEHPELPVPTWSHGTISTSLHGHLHGAGFDELNAYAEVLGGSIAPGRDYEFNGQMMRPHYLNAVWRDVQVTVVVVLPAPVAVVTA